MRRRFHVTKYEGFDRDVDRMCAKFFNKLQENRKRGRTQVDLRNITEYFKIKIAVFWYIMRCHLVHMFFRNFGTYPQNILRHTPEDYCTYQ
jgi:hypothetical protein